MTQQELLNTLLEQYHLVHVMADKNDCRVLHLRNKQIERDLVVRQLPNPTPVYEALCAVVSDHLPQVYDVIEAEDGYTVLEEYIDGITIADAMAERRYTYREARKILRCVCHALSVLHEDGFVHRDVKPENVLVRPDGQAVLIDLNISRQVTTVEKDTQIMGTVGYAPPEQLGLTQSDARTDIYATGVLLNVMLTGDHPSVRMAPGRAGRIVRRCTDVSPGRRYQTAKKLAAAL